jgi:hypothetical protein
MFSQIDEDREIVKTKTISELVDMYNKETYWNSVSPDIILKQLNRRGASFYVKERGFYSDYDDGKLILR